MVMITGESEIQEKVYDRLLEAVKSGEISQERLEASLKRIIRVKKSL